MVNIYKKQMMIPKKHTEIQTNEKIYHSDESCCHLLNEHKTQNIIY